MIAWLSGQIIQKNPPHLIINVAGVGYAVETTLVTFSSLPNDNDNAELFIHTHVREDALTLFGFASLEEKHWFLELIKINGVGAKMALNLLSGLSVSELTDCVLTQNSKRLCSLPGIGKKTADRLLLELQDRLKNLSASNSTSHSASMTMSESAQTIAALESLGFKPAEAERMLKRIPPEALTGDLNVPEQVRLALKYQ